MAVDEKCHKSHFAALVYESLLFFSYAIPRSFDAVPSAKLSFQYSSHFKIRNIDVSPFEILEVFVQ